jgi:hypothetical protein
VIETAREALAHVQAKIHAPKNQRNDFGKYNYRNAEGIIAAFKAVAPEGAALTMTDRIEAIGDRVFLITTATFHWAGETITSESAAMHAMQKKGMDDAQITGACSSYARKYALCGLLLIDDSTADPDSRDNRHQERAETSAREPQQQAERDPVEVRDGLLAAIAKVDSNAKVLSLQASKKYNDALNWLREADPPKANEVAHALVQKENAINATPSGHEYQ